LRSRSATRVRPWHAAIGALSLGTAVSLSLSVTALGLAAEPAKAPGAAAAPAAPVATTTDRPRHHRRLPAELHVKRRDRDVRAGTSAQIAGTLLPRRAGRAIVVEGGSDGRWRVLARGTTRANGHFRVHVAAPEVGTIRLRVRFPGDRRARPARARAGTLQAFRPSLASWYALYGNRTACGQTLGYETLGVAHKSLPCGTMVTLKRGRRSLRVPVIDRGPYVGGREYDLTAATAQRLGFSGHGAVLVTR
jgi:rare lipoprotein A